MKNTLIPFKKENKQDKSTLLVLILIRVWIMLFSVSVIIILFLEYLIKKA